MDADLDTKLAEISKRLEAYNKDESEDFTTWRVTQAEDVFFTNADTDISFLLNEIKRLKALLESKD